MYSRAQQKQSYAAMGILGLMLYCNTTATAQQSGRLTLPTLPASAHVYVDGKPAVTLNGKIAVSAGWHEIQVETNLPGKGIVAYRRPVRISASQSTEMPIVWHRVTLGVIENGAQGYFPPGTPGPAGEDGPPARAFHPLPPHPDVAELRQLLQEIRDTLLDDFLARTQQNVDSLYEYANLEYFYTAGGPLSVIRGPSGSPGSQGKPGLPAEARLIQTVRGAPFENFLTRSLGLQAMGQELSRLEEKLKGLGTSARAPAVGARPFTVLTPEWKAALDKERTAKLAVPRPQNAIIEVPSIWGPLGASGRRGPDGVPPADAATVRLTQEQEKTLLTALVEEKTAQEKLAQIKELLIELKQRIYLAEGLRLEQSVQTLK